MNKKGAAFIEILLIAPVIILFLHQFDCISRGWAVRIKNRVISRYVSTHHWRTSHTIPVMTLQTKFGLSTDDLQNLVIVNRATTRWRFHMIAKKAFEIEHRYYLGRSIKNEFFSENPF